MKPACPVTADVDIGRGHILSLLSYFKIDPSKKRFFVVSPCKLQVAASWLIFCIAYAKASSMAVLVTTDRVIIASDGILTSVKDGTSTPSQFCKIHREGRIFYGAVGDYGIPGTKDDLWNMARDAARSKTMLGIYEVIESKMLKSLPRIVRRNRIADPKTYSRWLAGDPVTSIVFASFEKGNPVVVSVSFNIDPNGVPIRPPARNTLYAVPGQVKTGRFGYTKEMTAAIGSNLWGRRFLADPIGASRDLIQVEIDAAIREHRKDVGAPISIVEITGAGGAWVPGYKGACQ